MMGEKQIKLKAQKKKVTSTYKQLDTKKLKNRDLPKDFCISLKNRFEALNITDEKLKS